MDINLNIKTVNIDGQEYKFLLSTWVTKVFSKNNALGPLESYRQDSVNTSLDIAYISFKEADPEQGKVSERDFNNLYSAMGVKEREELKETLAEYFLDLDPEKTLVSQFRHLWVRCTFEQKEEIKEYIENPDEGNLNGKPRAKKAKA